MTTKDAIKHLSYKIAYYKAIDENWADSVSIDALEIAVRAMAEPMKGRYIDAEELKHILNNSKYYGTTEGDAFADMIAECESIKERNKGKWSIEETNTYELSYGVTAYAPVYKCSACGRSIESHLMLDEPIVPEDANFSRFCPWCGADMREEKTDDGNNDISKDS